MLFLPAKVHQQVDHDNSNLAKRLLSIIYPFSLLPLPSLSILKLNLTTKLNQTKHLDKYAKICYQTGKDQLHFRLASDFNLLPIILNHGTLQPIKNLPDQVQAPPNALSFIKLSVSSMDKKTPVSNLITETVTIYVDVYKQHRSSLIEFMMSNQIGSSLFSESDRFSSELMHHNISIHGFSGESYLPDVRPSYNCFQAFSEYCAYEDKPIIYIVIEYRVNVIEYQSF